MNDNNFFSKMLKQRKLILAFSIFWTLGIFIGCSMPGSELPKVNLFDHFDKVIHFLFFFIFYALWTAYYSFSQKSLVVFLIVSFFYGIGIEYYQRDFVAGRSFDFWDAVADFLGALSALVIIRKFFNKMN